MFVVLGYNSVTALMRSPHAMVRVLSRYPITSTHYDIEVVGIISGRYLLYSLTNRDVVIYMFVCIITVA